MDPILLKILVAAVVAFVISAVIGKFLVPALRRWKAGQIHQGGAAPPGTCPSRGPPPWAA